MQSDSPILRASVAPWGSGISCENKIRIYLQTEGSKGQTDLQIRQTVFQWIHGQSSSFNDAKIHRLHGETNALGRQGRRRSFQMLIIHCKSHYVSYRLDRERSESWDRKEINLMICRTSVRKAITRKTNNVLKYQIVRAPAKDWVWWQFHLSVYRQVMFGEIRWCMILAVEM